jgi:hypothetical protein
MHAGVGQHSGWVMWVSIATAVCSPWFPSPSQGMETSLS